MDVRIVSSNGISENCDIFICDGKISGIHKHGIVKPEGKIFSGNGLLALPGMIDIHFHAGMSSAQSVYKDMRIESKCAAAGGFTYLRSHLIIGSEGINGYSKIIDTIIKNTEKVSAVDFTFNPMIGTMKQAEDIDILVKKGINAFKIYYNAYRGQEGRALGINTDDNIGDIVFESLKRSAKFNKTRIIFHAEDNNLTNYFTNKEIENGNNGLEAFSRARPPIAEVTKINEICSLAMALNAKIHIAHISSIDAFNAVAKWRNSGVNVTMETEPHYLAFDYSMWNKIGIYGKVNPPLRGANDRQFLIDMVSKKQIDSISTDTNTLTKQEKTHGESLLGNIWNTSPGFDNIQLMLPFIVTNLVKPGIIDYPTLTWLTAERPANLICANRKGTISIGNDADIVIIDTKTMKVPTDKNMIYSPGLEWSPFSGKKMTGFSQSVFLRGNCIFENGQLIDETKGEHVYINDDNYERL